MKKKTVEEFKKEFYELTNNDYELLSNYETAIKKVKVKHKECGNEYEVTPNKFLTGRRCPYCRWIETARKESISQEVAEDRIKNISDGEFVLVSKINGTSNKVTVECIKCGKRKEIIYCNFISRYTPCECNEKSSKNIRINKKEKELVDYCNNNGYKIMESYKNSHSHILVKHLKCEKEWKVSPSNLKRGFGCPYCKESKGEKEISRILDKYNIEYIPQYIFNDCFYINPLKFDFYLPKYNLCIEYQGQQHYKPISLFGGEEGYKNTVIRDKIKEKYCIENKIPLLKIKYTNYKNIEKILLNYIRKED